MVQYAEPSYQELVAGLQVLWHTTDSQQSQSWRASMKPKRRPVRISDDVITASPPEIENKKGHRTVRAIRLLNLVAQILQTNNSPFFPPSRNQDKIPSPASQYMHNTHDLMFRVSRQTDGAPCCSPGPRTTAPQPTRFYCEFRGRGERYGATPRYKRKNLSRFDNYLGLR